MNVEPLYRAIRRVEDADGAHRGEPFRRSQYNEYKAALGALELEFRGYLMAFMSDYLDAREALTEEVDDGSHN